LTLRIVAIVALVGLAGWGAVASGIVPAEDGSEQGSRAIVVRDYRGSVIASVPLHGDRFAVSYRNSIYGTPAEERYRVLADGRYRLRQIAAAQLAVLEEYYSVSSAPERARERDRQRWVVAPNPERTPTFETLSIAATDLGQRTVHVPGEPPLALWKLVGPKHPFVELSIEKAS